MEAATMTPAANPVSARCTVGFIFFFMSSTQAEPSAVPKNGIRMPNAAFFIACPPKDLRNFLTVPK